MKMLREYTRQQTIEISVCNATFQRTNTLTIKAQGSFENTVHLYNLGVFKLLNVRTYGYISPNELYKVRTTQVG